MEEQPSAILSGPALEISGLAFSPDGRFAFAGAKDNKLFKWNLASRDFHSAGDKTGKIVRFAFTPDGQQMAVGLPGGTVTTSRVDTGAVLWTKASDGEGTHRGEIQFLVFAQDPVRGLELISASKDGTVRFWNASDGELRQTWKFSERSPVKIDLHLGSRRMVTLNDQNVVKVWKPSNSGYSYKLLKSFEKVGEFTQARFMPDSDELLLSTADHQIEIRQTSTTNLVHRFKPAEENTGHHAKIESLALSPNGEMVASGDDEGRTLLWDAATGKSLAEFEAQATAIVQLAFSADSRRLLSGNRAGVVDLWDLSKFHREEVPETSEGEGQTAQPKEPAESPPVSGIQGASFDEIDTYLIEQLEKGQEQAWLRTEKGLSDKNEHRLRELLSRGSQSDTKLMRRVIQQFRIWGGEIFVLPLKVLRQGVKLRVDTGALYFARETLRQADLEAVEQAMITRDFSGLLAWTDEHLKEEEIAEPEPGPTPEVIRKGPELQSIYEEIAAEYIADSNRLNQQELDAWESWDAAAQRAEESVYREIAAAYQQETEVLKRQEEDWWKGWLAQIKASEVSAVDPQKFKQDLAVTLASAERGELMPNTLVLSSNLRQPDTMTLAFDTADSSPDAFENVQLFDDADVVLIVSDPKRWNGRSRMTGTRFSVTLPVTFEEGKKLAEQVMTPSWRSQMRELDRTLGENSRSSKSTPSLQRRLLQDLIRYSKGILSLSDSQKTDARQRLEAELKDPAKVDELIEAFDQMDRRMVKFYKRTESVIEEVEKGAEQVEVSEARRKLEEVSQVIPETSAAWKALEGYLSRLGAEAVARSVLLAFLGELRNVMSNEQIPILSQKVPMGRLGAVYHDAMRLARLRQLAEYRRSLEDPQVPLEDLPDRVPLTAQQIYLTEWENAFYRYVLEEAKPAESKEQVSDYRLTGLGILFLNPDGSLRRFVPGGGSINRGQMWSASYHTYRLEQWYKPGDRMVLLFASDSGYPNLWQIGAFFNDLPLLQARFGEVLLGTVATKDGAVRVFKPDLLVGDFERWSRITVQVNGVSDPYQQFQEKVTGGIFDMQTWLEKGQAFLKILSDMAHQEYGPEAAGRMMEGARLFLKEPLDELSATISAAEEGSIERQLRDHLIRLYYKVIVLWSEWAASPLVGNGALLEPLNIPGLTDPNPAKWPGEETPPVSPEQVRTAMKEAADRALDGYWGSHRAGVSFTELGQEAMKVFLGIPSSLPQDLPFVMVSGRPSRAAPVPAPGEISGRKPVQAGGRYVAEVTWQEIMRIMARNPGLVKLKEEVKVHEQDLVRKSRTAKERWLRETVEALRGELEKKGDSAGGAEDRIQKARQRLGAEQVDKALVAFQELYRKQVEIREASIRAGQAVHAAKWSEEDFVQQMEATLLPVIQAAAAWPQLAVYSSFILKESERQRDPEQGLNMFFALLEEINQGLQQYPTFWLRENVDHRLLNAVYYDAFRWTFRQRLAELEAQDLLKGEPADDLLVELHFLAAWLLNVVEEETFYHQVQEKAKEVPADWYGSGLPIGGAGVLFLKDRRPCCFFEGAGAVVRDRHLTAHYFNSPLEQMLSSDRRDVAVLVYPSIQTGGANPEQVRSFLEDWFLLKPHTGSEIWMGMMTESGILRLYRPLMNPENLEEWAALRHRVKEEEGAYQVFRTFVYNVIFSPSVEDQDKPLRMSPLAKELAGKLKIAAFRPSGPEAERERLYATAQNMERILQQGLAESFGQGRADEIWAVIEPHFHPHLRNLKELDSQQSLALWVPQVAYSVLMAVGELEALPFMTDGKMFAQESIPDFSSSEPAAAHAAEPLKPHPVSIPAQAIPWEPAPPPGPLGEPVDAATLQERLKEVVPGLLNGDLGRDQTVLWYGDSNGSSVGIYGDISGTAGLGPKFRLAPLTRTVHVPLIPDPRQVRPGATSYSSEVNMEDVRDQAAEPIRLLSRPGSDAMVTGTGHYKLSVSPDEMRRELPLLLGRIREVLEKPDEKGRRPAERLSALEKSDPNRRKDRRRAVEAVERLVQERIKAEEEIIAAQRRFGRIADAKDKVPVREGLDILRSVISTLHEQSRVAVGLRVYMEGFGTLNELDPSDLNDVLDDALWGLRQEAQTLLPQRAAGWALMEVYYDALRNGWLQEVRRLEERLGREDIGDRLIAAALWMQDEVLSLEIDAAFTRQVIQKAEVPARTERPDGAPPVGGIGVLLIDRENRMRLGLGASGMAPPLEFYANYDPEHLKPWIQDGDRIVLLYPGYQGPNLRQLNSFFEDYFRLRRELPGSPEIWLGMAKPNGEVKLFRPEGIPAPPTDEAAWAQSLGVVLEVNQNRFAPAWAVLDREILSRAVPVANAVEVSRHFATSFRRWLLQSQAYTEGEADEVVDAIRDHLKREVGADLKALGDQLAEVGMREGRRLQTGDRTASDQLIQAGRRLTYGMTAALSKSTMILLEMLAKSIMPLEGFTEVGVPGAAALLQEQVNRRAQELTDSFMNSGDSKNIGMTREQVLPEAQNFIAQWKGPSAKIRSVDFIKHMRELKRRQGEQARAAAEQAAKAAAEKAERERRRLADEAKAAGERAEREKRQRLADEAKAAAEKAEQAERQRSADEAKAAAEKAEQAEAERRRQEEEKKLQEDAAKRRQEEELARRRQQLERAKSPVPQLGQKKPRAAAIGADATVSSPPSGEPPPLEEPPLLQSPTSTAPVPTPPVQSAEPEIARIEKRLMTNLASPEADLQQLVEELDKANGIPGESLDPELTGRRAGIRMSLAGALSGRIFALVDQTLVEAAGLPLDQGKESIDRLLKQVQAASKVLEGLVVFQEPVQRQLAVVEGTRRALEQMSPLAEGDAVAVRQALRDSAGIPENEIHAVWQRQFLEARKSAAERLALGVAQHTEQVADPLVNSEKLETNEGKELLAGVTIWINDAGAFMDALQITGEMRDRLKAAEEGVRELSRIAQLKSNDFQMVEQGLRDSESPLKTLQPEWAERLRKGIGPVTVVYAETLVVTDRKSEEAALQAIEGGIDLLKRLGHSSSDLEKERTRLQGVVDRKRKEATTAAREAQRKMWQRILAQPVQYGPQEIAAAIVQQDSLMDLVRSDMAGGVITSGFLRAIAENPSSVTPSQKKRVAKQVDHRLESEEAKTSAGLTPLYQAIQVLIQKLPERDAAGLEESRAEEVRRKILGSPEDAEGPPGVGFFLRGGNPSSWKIPLENRIDGHRPPAQHLFNWMQDKIGLHVHFYSQRQFQNGMIFPLVFDEGGNIVDLEDPWVEAHPYPAQEYSEFVPISEWAGSEGLPSQFRERLDELKGGAMALVREHQPEFVKGAARLREKAGPLVLARSVTPGEAGLFILRLRRSLPPGAPYFLDPRGIVYQRLDRPAVPGEAGSSNLADLLKLAKEVKEGYTGNDPWPFFKALIREHLPSVNDAVAVRPAPDGRGMRAVVLVQGDRSTQWTGILFRLDPHPVGSGGMIYLTPVIDGVGGETGRIFYRSPVSSFELERSVIQLAGDLRKQIQLRPQATAPNQAHAEAILDSVLLKERIHASEVQTKGNVVFFLNSELFDSSGLAVLNSDTMAGLSLKLGETLRWPELNSMSLQVEVVSEGNRALYRSQYAGWNIIEVNRKEGSDARPLPPAAIPRIVAEAFAAGQSIFEVVVTPYLDLGRMTLDQVTQDLESYLFA